MPGPNDAILDIIETEIANRDDESYAQDMIRVRDAWRQLKDDQEQSTRMILDQGFGSLLIEAFKAGFVEACRWSEPVAEDANSPALYRIAAEKTRHMAQNSAPSRTTVVVVDEDEQFAH